MLGDESELSPQSIELLQAWIAGGSDSSPTLSDESLYVFASGLATLEEAERAVEALIASSDERQRLIQVRRELDTLSAAPLSDSSWLAHWLSTRLASSLEFCGQVREKCLSIGWDGIRDLGDARSSIAAVGRSLALLGSNPSFATTRASVSDAGALGESEVTLSVELLKDGTLVAHAEIVPVEPLLGWQLCLELVDPAGGYIPIGCDQVRSDGWRLRADGFGPISGLAPGVLAPSLFRLVPPDTPAPLHQGNHIYVEVEGGSATTFELAEEPRLEKGELVVTLGCSAFRRERFQNYRLELAIPLGSHLQVLGSWPMSGWQKDLQTFRVPVPGSSEGRLELGSILHVRLQLL